VNSRSISPSARTAATRCPQRTGARRRCSGPRCAMTLMTGRRGVASLSVSQRSSITRCTSCRRGCYTTGTGRRRTNAFYFSENHRNSVTSSRWNAWRPEYRDLIHDCRYHFYGYEHYLRRRSEYRSYDEYMRQNPCIE
jgi:hypothetical protein